MSPQHLRVEHQGLAAWIWMTRPAVHNAFDEVLVAELADAFQRLSVNEQVRVIVLAAEGASFSAGADLQWMQRQGQASLEANLADAQRLALLFRRIAECPKPTLARVQGAALGGGLGLVAACDIAVATTQASFGTTEVRLGLIPSVISPYVLRAMGARQATRYFQTGERFSAHRAWALGLIHEVCTPERFDEQVQQLIQALLAGGPKAQAAATDLIRAVANQPIDDALVDDTACRIGRLRATPEAREGVAAFLDKRAPTW